MMRLHIPTTLLGRALGLMDPRIDPMEEDAVLLLARCKSIHTFGMSYPIDVAFIGRQGDVVRSIRVCPPMRIRSHARAVMVLERRARTGPWLQEGDTVEFSCVARSAPVAMQGKRGCLVKGECR